MSFGSQAHIRKTMFMGPRPPHHVSCTLTKFCSAEHCKEGPSATKLPSTSVRHSKRFFQQAMVSVEIMLCVLHMQQLYQRRFVDKAAFAGVEQLPAATPYAMEALSAPSHALRRLGCQQLGAALPVCLPTPTACCST